MDINEDTIRMLEECKTPVYQMIIKNEDESLGTKDIVISNIVKSSVEIIRFN